MIKVSLEELEDLFNPMVDYNKKISEDEQERNMLPTMEVIDEHRKRMYRFEIEL